MKKTGIAHLTFCVFLFSSFLSPQAGSEQAPITTKTLLYEMVDLAGLTSYPDPAYKTVQFSSFDRRSTLPAGQGWFANSDGFGREPIPNFEKVLKEPDETGVGEYLICEINGPGAVVRLWTAAISGKIRLFLDQEVAPLYDGPAVDFFHRFYSHFVEAQGLKLELLEKTLYQRDAAYTPIPFSSGMKIVWVGNIQEIHFYQVGVRLYPQGTEVVTFTPRDLAAYKDDIDRVTAILSDPDRNIPQVHPSDTDLTINLNILPGEKKEVVSLEGPGAVGRLVLKLEAADLQRALRQTVLHIVCDDHPWGQVQSPVGDFFGAAPGINPYDSLPFTVKPDGTMVCRFVMPFQKSMKVFLENFGEQEVKTDGSATHMPFAWQEDSTMHFRARWRVDHELIASNIDVQDLPFLIAHGKGLYVGTAAFLLNPNDVPIPYGSWWGEGDEKVFVDEDKVPSIFGTGSEDYFNYSWSVPDIFWFPYCGQPRNDGPANRGFVTNFRWHILDPLPFERTIRFLIELYSHERTPGLSYARTGYYYALPGSTDDHLAIKPSDLRPLALPENWKPASRMGARNSVFFEAEDIASSLEQTRMEKDNLWAGGSILVWVPGEPGETQSFLLKVEEGGTKRIHLAMALTPKSGRVSFMMDDQVLSLGGQVETLDLFRPYRTLLRNFTFPEMELEPGVHTLTLKFAGADGSVQAPEVGVDFIWIQKVEKAPRP